MTRAKYFTRPIDLAALILLAVITVTGGLIAHSLSADMYYHINLDFRSLSELPI
jgi:hypothetical protein